MQRRIVRVLEGWIPAAKNQVFECGKVQPIGEGFRPFALLGEHAQARRLAAKHELNACEECRRDGAMCANYQYTKSFHEFLRRLATKSLFRLILRKRSLDHDE